MFCPQQEADAPRRPRGEVLAMAESPRNLPTQVETLE